MPQTLLLRLLSREEMDLYGLLYILGLFYRESVHRRYLKPQLWIGVAGTCNLKS